MSGLYLAVTSMSGCFLLKSSTSSFLPWRRRSFGSHVPVFDLDFLTGRFLGRLAAAAAHDPQDRGHRPMPMQEFFSDSFPYLPVVCSMSSFSETRSVYPDKVRIMWNISKVYVRIRTDFTNSCQICKIFAKFCFIAFRLAWYNMSKQSYSRERTCKGAYHHETAQISGPGQQVFCLCHDHVHRYETEISTGGCENNSFTSPLFGKKGRRNYALYNPACWKKTHPTMAPP